jgi:hypothetical protein
LLPVGILDGMKNAVTFLLLLAGPALADGPPPLCPLRNLGSFFQEK